METSGVYDGDNKVRSTRICKFVVTRNKILYTGYTTTYTIARRPKIGEIDLLNDLGKSWSWEVNIYK